MNGVVSVHSEKIIQLKQVSLQFSPHTAHFILVIFCDFTLSVCAFVWLFRLFNWMLYNFNRTNENTFHHISWESFLALYFESIRLYLTIHTPDVQIDISWICRITDMDVCVRLVGCYKCRQNCKVVIVIKSAGEFTARILGSYIQCIHNIHIVSLLYVSSLFISVSFLLITQPCIRAASAAT